MTISPRDRDVLSTGMPPLLAEPAGMTAQEEEDKLKAQYPVIYPGTVADIPPELRRQYLFALAAVKSWQHQLHLARNQIRRHMGYAETALCDGEPVASRYQCTTDTYVVSGYEKDYIAPVSSMPSGTKRKKDRRK